ncbi:MAG: hypothetical protein QXW98_07540 [Candidatus Caldarchaeum sp.]
MRGKDELISKLVTKFGTEYLDAKIYADVVEAAYNIASDLLDLEDILEVQYRFDSLPRVEYGAEGLIIAFSFELSPTFLKFLGSPRQTPRMFFRKFVPTNPDWFWHTVESMKGELLDQLSDAQDKIRSILARRTVREQDQQALVQESARLHRIAYQLHRLQERYQIYIPTESYQLGLRYEQPPQPLPIPMPQLPALPPPPEPPQALPPPGQLTQEQERQVKQGFWKSFINIVKDVGMRVIYIIRAVLRI